MAYLFLFCFLAHVGGFVSLLTALMLWCMGLALIHAAEEAGGALWEHFGEISGNKLIAEAGPFFGFFVMVVPALGIQLIASYVAFGGEVINPVALAVLIGAQVGDAVFSHFRPTAQGYKHNPGLPSAVGYLVTGLLLYIAFHVPLMNEAKVTIPHALGGAAFFAAVLPGLRWFGGE